MVTVGPMLLVVFYRPAGFVDRVYAHAMKPCIPHGYPNEFLVWGFVFPFKVSFECGFETFSCNFGEVLFHHNHLVAITVIITPRGCNGVVCYLLLDLSYFFYVVCDFNDRDTNDISLVLKPETVLGIIVVNKEFGVD